MTLQAENRTIRAWQYTKGAISPIFASVSAPFPAANQIAIEVRATNTSPSDLLITSGHGHAVFDLPPTVGIGWDLAGVVVAVGAGVTRFAQGDRVAALDNQLTAPLRALSEFVVIGADAAAHLPDDLSFEFAAEVPLSALTARQNVDLFGPPAGRSLLITGAAGAVGGFALAIAAAEGWHVTALARATDADFVTASGAADLITALGGAKFDAVFDPAGMQERALAAVRDGGHFVGVRPSQPIASERGITVQAQGVRADGATLEKLLLDSARGVLPHRITGTTPLANAPALWTAMQAGGVRGRVILIP